MKIVAVHSGDFHPDDVFSIAILRLLYPELKVVRTREKKIYSKADARIDVGQEYSFKTLDFDHHQSKGAGIRKNKIPYASVGLIWKHFGHKLASPKAWEIIDRKIIQPIDANDNGVKLYKNALAEPYGIGSVIDAFNPNWREKKKDYDKRFEEAVGFATMLMKREIFEAEGAALIKSDAHIKSIIKYAIKRRQGYIVFEHYIPWRVLIDDIKSIKYVIFPEGKSWIVRAVPKSSNSFESKRPLPQAWAGLSNAKLAKISGVDDAIFCHKNRFIASAQSMDGAIAMAKISLKK